MCIWLYNQLFRSSHSCPTKGVSHIWHGLLLMCNQGMAYLWNKGQHRMVSYPIYMPIHLLFSKPVNCHLVHFYWTRTPTRKHVSPTEGWSTEQCRSTAKSNGTKKGLRETHPTTTWHIRSKENPTEGIEGLNKNTQKKGPRGSQTAKESGKIINRMDEPIRSERKTPIASHGEKGKASRQRNRRQNNAKQHETAQKTTLIAEQRETARNGEKKQKRPRKKITGKGSESPRNRKTAKPTETKGRKNWPSTGQLEE